MTALASPTARVLIADDSAVCRGVLVILLETAGYDVISVYDGNEALQALRTHTFDLAILDNDMPNLGGMGALTELRGFLPELPVVVCSGTVTAAETARYHELGVDDVLSKPVDPRTLRTKIADILTRRSLQSPAGPALLSFTGRSAAIAAPALPPPLLGGTSRFASKLQADLLRLRDFRSVAIIEGAPGSGRFELAMNLVPATGVHAFVCHADDLNPALLDTLLKPAHTTAQPVLFTVLEADQLSATQQSLLEDLVLGRLPSQAALGKRLRLVLCAKTSLCDLHFNEFLLMRASTAMLMVPEFSERWQDWGVMAQSILRRAGTGRGTFAPDAIKWIDRHTWTGDYMQLHRTIELARRRAGVATIITVGLLEAAFAEEPTSNQPLFHDLLFHVHSGDE